MATHKNIVTNISLKLLAIATMIFALTVTPSWSGNGPKGSTAELSDLEIEHLNFTREEEKLARDVYLILYGKWNAKIFSQISLSEQQHMDTMLKMLDKYGLPDPAEDDFGDINEIGVFNNEDLQDLYNTLVEKGVLSYVDGLEVGAIIEVTDIIDINDAVDITNNTDLLTAYGHLIDGSYNHLASFCSTLEKQGVPCDTQGIDSALFDAIMDIY